jgi:hypothetical protein
MVALQYKSGKYIEKTNLDGSLQIRYIHHHWTSDGDEEREKTKGKLKFNEDESPDLVTLSVKFVGKEDIGLFFFPQHLETTSTPLH